MTINAVAVAVEVAFGFGPNSNPTPGDWVDITNYLDITASSSGIVASSGRDNPRSGISPGSLSFSLENADGRFNPRNTAGPYYGTLDDGALIRIQVTYASVTTTRWLGFINSGWPQNITSRYPTVTITAQDVLGLVAQAEAPETGFDAEVAALALEPDYWFQAGQDGWLDRKSGEQWNHTGALTKFDTPLIDGREEVWGQVEPDGHGLVEDTLVYGSTGNTIVVSLWCDLSYVFNASGTEFPLLTQEAITAVGGYVGNSFNITMKSRVINGTPLVGISAYFFENVAGVPEFQSQIDSVYSGTNEFLNGKQHIMFAFRLPYIDPDPFVQTKWWSPDLNSIFGDPTDPQFFGIWINGELAGQYGTANSPLTGGLDTLPSALIGSSSRYYDAGTTYKGALDEVMVWQNHTASFDDLGVIAVNLNHSGRTPWANERLDQRIGRLASSFEVNNVGSLDVSGIVSQQSYRKASPLELFQKIEDTEQGRISVDSNGDITFTSRQWAWDKAVSNTVQLTFSDDPTLIAGGAQDMLEGGTIVKDDPFNLVNVASVTSTYGTKQTNEDLTSIAKYGRRNPIALTGLLHSSDRQSYAIADWLLISQGTPQMQVTQLSFRVEDNPTVLAPFAAAVEEGWLIRVVKTTSAEVLDVSAHVIGITHEWTFGGWNVTLKLDSTRTGYSFFKWGTSNWDGAEGWSF